MGQVAGNIGLLRLSEQFVHVVQQLARWARLMKRLSADAPRTSYHSLRHNWANACRDAKMNDPIMQALGGWSSQSGTAGRYGSEFDVAVLAEEIAKISPLSDGILDTTQQEIR